MAVLSTIGILDMLNSGGAADGMKKTPADISDEELTDLFAKHKPKNKA